MLELVWVLLKCVTAAVNWTFEGSLIRVSPHVIKQVVPFSEQFVALFRRVDPWKVFLTNEDTEDPISCFVSEFDAIKALRWWHFRLALQLFEIHLFAMFGLELGVTWEIKRCPYNAVDILQVLVVSSISVPLLLIAFPFLLRFKQLERLSAGGAFVLDLQVFWTLFFSRQVSGIIGTTASRTFYNLSCPILAGE